MGKYSLKKYLGKRGDRKGGQTDTTISHPVERVSRTQPGKVGHGEGKVRAKEV